MEKKTFSSLPMTFCALYKMNMCTSDTMNTATTQWQQQNLFRKIDCKTAHSLNNGWEKTKRPPIVKLQSTKYCHWVALEFVCVSVCVCVVHFEIDATRHRFVWEKNKIEEKSNATIDVHRQHHLHSRRVDILCFCDGAAGRASARSEKFQSSTEFYKCKLSATLHREEHHAHNQRQKPIESLFIGVYFSPLFIYERMRMNGMDWMD